MSTTTEKTQERLEVDQKVEVTDFQVGGGQISFKVRAEVSCQGKDWVYLDSRFTFTLHDACEQPQDVKNDVFVVKDQKICLVYSKWEVTYEATARFRPIPQSETTFKEEFKIPVPHAR